MKFEGDDASNLLLAKITEGVKGLENQPKTSERYSGLDMRPATYGVVKQLRDNDMELHSNQQVRWTAALDFHLLFAVRS